MKVTGADHANWRITDVGRTFAFYRDVLGLETFGVEEFRAGKSSFVSVRVSPGFTLHLRPDPEFEPSYAETEDHLALVVEGASKEEVEEHLKGKGVEIDRAFERALGARGIGPAVYLRDPDGYRIELKVYEP